MDSKKREKNTQPTKFMLYIYAKFLTVSSSKTYIFDSIYNSNLFVIYMVSLRKTSIDTGDNDPCGPQNDPHAHNRCGMSRGFAAYLTCGRGLVFEVQTGR